MDNNSKFINQQSLVNILTLRYDPSIIPNFIKKKFQEFISTQDEPNIHQIEKSICNNIEQKLRTFDNKKICIALSGGVDSTLVLSLLRKIKPDIDIEALSIKFANSVDETKAASKIAHKFNDFIVKAIGLAMQKNPNTNVYWQNNKIYNEAAYRGGTSISVAI